MKTLKIPRLLRSKKAINDISIISGIIIIFVLIGVFLPYLNQEFPSSASATNISGIEDDLSGDAEGIDDINAFDVLVSVLKMFFWTFGDLPFWLDTMFIILRIIFIVTVARNIWIGGGS